MDGRKSFHRCANRPLRRGAVDGSDRVFGAPEDHHPRTRAGFFVKRSGRTRLEGQAIADSVCRSDHCYPSLLIDCSGDFCDRRADLAGSGPAYRNATCRVTPRHWDSTTRHLPSKWQFSEFACAKSTNHTPIWLGNSDPLSASETRPVSQNSTESCLSEYRDLWGPGSFQRAKEAIMKIVAIGGTGLIGSKLVSKLREQGHDAIPASPNSGVNTLTGEGLAEVLKGASVVVDVSNSPSWEDAAVMNFFETSTRNLLTHEAAAGVGHHVALSVVGTDRLSESGYFRAKIAQEKLIKSASIPYSIVHATQFFEFLKGLADISSEA